MKTATKNLFIAFFGAILLFALSVAMICVFAPKLTKATVEEMEGGEDFYVYGASIRAMNEDTNNLPAVRFLLVISEDFYSEHNIYTVDQDVNFSVKLMAEELIESGKNILNTSRTGNVKTVEVNSVWKPSEYVSGYYETTVNIYGISSLFYDHNLAIVALATSNAKAESEFMYYTEQESCSLAWVAWKSNDSVYDTYRPDYTVSFNANGGTAVANETVKYGNTITSVTSKSDYTFDRWAVDGTRDAVGEIFGNTEVTAIYSRELNSTNTPNGEAFTANISADLTAEYTLTSNIDMSKAANGSAYQISRYNNIGSDGSTFTGVLDGDGHTLTGLTLTYQGALFAKTSGAVIKNINVDNVSIVSYGTAVFVYQITGASYIDNVYVSVKSWPNADSNDNQTNSGLVFYPQYTYTVSNSVVYMPDAPISMKIGFLGGWAPGPISINNSLFIGEIAYKAEGGGYLNIQGNTRICSAVEAHTTYSELMSSDHYSMYCADHPYLEVTSSNFATAIKNATNEVLDLTENVALTGDWTKGSKTFTGVFEGNGHTITGLTMLTNNSLFNTIENANIRNVNFVDVVFKKGSSSSGSAVLAHVSTGTCKFDNIYVSVKGWPSTDITANYGIFVFYSYTGRFDVTNCTAYAPGVPTSLSFGFLRGSGQRNDHVKDCVFIGGSGVNGGANVTNIVTDNCVLCSAVAAHKTYSSDMGSHYAKFNTNHPYVALTSSNIRSALQAATNEIFDLTENITLSNDAWVNTTAIFTGVLEGNGYTLTNLITMYKGLFQEINGATIQNLVLKGVDFKTYQQGGVIAYQTSTYPSCISNVYVGVTGAGPDNATDARGAIINRTFVPVYLSNSVVYIEDANATNARIGFVKGNKGNNYVYVKNSVFISDYVTTYIGQVNGPVGTVTPDANSGMYTTAQVNAAVLAKMSDQNYKAYTGLDRAA